MYPWGDNPPTCELVNALRCNEDTKAVGTYPAGASPYGALDMAGNVWEWVADWYDGTYYGVSPGENPPGPSSGGQRVRRGGSWIYGPDDVRAANRYGNKTSNTLSGVGFRCAGSP
jgi:formylglycine-generating enzyme required for sulfatase activity